MTLEEFKKKKKDGSLINARSAQSQSSTSTKMSFEEFKTKKQNGTLLNSPKASEVANVKEEQPQIKASDVRKVDIRDFDLMSGTTGQKIKLDSQIENLSKQIQQKENDYVRANNISDWDKKTQAKTEIGKELNELKSKLSSAQTSREQLNENTSKILTPEQYEEMQKNAPFAQKIEKAIKQDIPQTAEKVGRTGMDLIGNIATGITKGMEGYADAAVGVGGTALSGIANLAGKKETAQNIKNKAEEIAGYGFAKGMEDLVDEKSQQGAGIYKPSILGVDVRDAAQEIARMYAVGATGGLPGFMVSASGGNIEEALNEGESLGRATAYGAISGSLEGIVEKMFDPAKILGGGLKTIGKGFLGKIAEATVGEGAEEGITAALNPFIKMLTYKGETENPFGSWENFKNYLKDIGQSVYQGAVIGGLTLGVSAPGNVDLQKSFSNDVYKAVEKIQGINQAKKNEIANAILEGANIETNNLPKMDTATEKQLKLLKNVPQNGLQNVSNQQTNVTLPTQAEMTQKANTEQINNMNKMPQDFMKQRPVYEVEIEKILPYLTRGGHRETEKVEKLRDNIKKNGIKKPVELMTNSKGEIVINDGNHRLQIAQELGIKNIPVQYLDSNSQKMLELDSFEEYNTPIDERWDSDVDGTGGQTGRQNQRSGITEKDSSYIGTLPDRTNTTAENDKILGREQGYNNRPSSDTTRRQDIAGQEIIEADAKSAFSMPKNGILNFASSEVRKPYMDLNKYSSRDAMSPTEKTRLTDIQNAINEIVPVKTGKFRQKAYGIYKNAAEIIRLKQTKDIPVALHELSHHLDKKYNLSGTNKAFDELQKIAIAKENADKDTISKEGVAEFGRYYMTDKDYAKEIAPFYYEMIEKALNNDPAMKEKVDNIRNMLADYLQQSPQNRVLSNIDNGDTEVSLWNKSKDSIVKAAKSFRKNFVDDLAPLEKIVKEISNNDDLPTSKNAYELLRLNNGVTGKVRVALEYGVVNDNGEKIGKSLKEILKPVSDRQDEFVAYISALRANDLYNRDIESGLPQKDVLEVLKTYKDDEVFKNAAKELYQFQNQILSKTLVKSGIITRESLENYNKANPHYVPFYRVMDENYKRGADSLSKAPKKIKGSTRDIINPLESIIKNTYSYMQIAEKNDAYKTLFSLSEKYDGTGKWFDKVPTDMIGTKVTATDVKNILEKLNLDNEDADYNNVFTTIFKPSYTQKGNIVTVMDNGKPVHYEINDKELYEILSPANIGKKENLFLTLLNSGSKALRVGATHSADFILRNPIRDTMDAGIYSKNGFIPFKDTIAGIFEIARKTDLYYKWLESGGSGSTYTNAQRQALRNTLNSITEETANKSTLETIKDVAKHPLRTYLDVAGNISNILEEGTRVGEFKKALQNTGDTRKAALESRNITVDFSRGGTQARDLNKYIAFLNANIQGLDKIVTSFKERPIATGMKAVAYLTIPSIIIRALQDDDEMEKVPQWEKDTYWVFFVGDTPVKLPKPQGLGQLFATVPERVIGFIKTQDPKAFDGLLERLLSSYSPIDSPTSIIPTGGQPLIENATNYSFFRQQPIVKQSLQNRSPEYQYDENTSTIAKKIGAAINYSPKKIDNLISGYFGNLGKDVTNILGAPFDAYDNFTGENKGEKEYESVNAKLKKMPVIKGFIAGDTASKTMDEFYDSKTKANTDYTDAKFKYSETKMTAKQQKELEYLKSINSIYNKAYNDIKDIDDQMDDISKSARKDEYKKTMLDKLKKQKDKIAEETKKEADKIKAKNTLITQAELKEKLKK